MPQFILEIGTEEIPARFLPELMSHLYSQFQEQLKERWIPYGEIEVFSTPRRLVLSGKDLAEVQQSREEVITGPPARVAYNEQGELTKAGQGFAKSQNVDPGELFIQESPKGQYLAVNKRLGGAETLQLLPHICGQILHKLPFPKKMRWEESGFTFGRPIRWILALLDSEVVPVTVASLTADRFTWGHRVLGPGPFQIARAQDYFQTLREQGWVIMDRRERRNSIREQGDVLAAEHQGRVVWSGDLLEEVTDLVEWPKPILGSFEEKFLELPREVLLTSMESHQKSFGLEQEQGRLLPYFLCTLNLEPKDLELVRIGWERVLKARLEDAAFFWKVDSNTPLEKWQQELEKVVFLGPLGSLGDKSRRLQQISCFLAGGTASDLESELLRASQLAKTDLVSEMVGEFDNLQGTMGCIYARQKGESETVARAIFEHYLPTGQDSPLPETTAGALLAIADKVDNLTGCFGLNMIPTGAHDPYALRRQALGIVRILLEKGLRLSLQELLEKAREAYGEVEWKLGPEQSSEALLEFFAQRLRASFAGQGYETRIVEAAVQAGLDDVYLLSKRLEALDRFSREPDFEQSVLTFKRADNIIRKQGDTVSVSLDGSFDASLLQEDKEQELARHLESMKPRWEELWHKEAFDDLLGLLRELRPVVDGFFDQVMVMTEDLDLRANRLNLLQSLVARLSQLAAFNALQI